MTEETEETSQEEVPTEGKTEKPCPVPPEHVQLFQDCCSKYEKGEISDIDVMIEVAKSLKNLKQTKPEPTE